MRVHSTVLVSSSRRLGLRSLPNTWPLRQLSARQIGQLYKKTCLHAISGNLGIEGDHISAESKSTTATNMGLNELNTIVWFRKGTVCACVAPPILQGLRLHDNPALQAACKSAAHVHPLFIIDPWFMNPDKVGVNRLRFLLDSLEDLDQSLRAKNSQLFVIQGTPQAVLPRLFQQWDVQRLCYECDTEPYARERDAQVNKIAQNAGVEVVSPASHTLYDTDWVTHKAGGKVPITYQSFLKLIAELGPPPAALEPPLSIPPPRSDAVSKLSSETGPHIPSLKELGYPEPEHARHLQEMQARKMEAPIPLLVITGTSTSYTRALNHATHGKFKIGDQLRFTGGLGMAGAVVSNGPLLMMQGGIILLMGCALPCNMYRFQGGESAGLALMEKTLSRREWVANFEKPNTAPTDFNPASTTKLSPYMKFGCVSARLFHSRLVEIYRSTPKSTNPPVSLEGQVLWREFFYTVGSNTPNFDRMVGNSICKQVDWDENNDYLLAWEGVCTTTLIYCHIMRIFKTKYRKQCAFLNIVSFVVATGWRPLEARTGYPWIDAAMTQLRTQGWLHHLARHAVACFLTRGDLYISWEKGRDVFDKYLLDADWALNNGNWMWLSASAFFSQYFRVYGPVSFGRKTDPDGKYIKHFLPVLKDMPKKYIYEPWKAPLEVQKQAKCIVGKDYPHPIVDHDTIHKTNISRMAEAYKRNKASQPASGSPVSKKKQKR